MTMPAPEADGFDVRQLHRVLWALRDHLEELVVVGGWVPALHRMSGLIPTWRSALSRTTECDLLVDVAAAGTGRTSIPAVLREHGFAPDDAGARHAVWRNPEDDASVEFLVPHRGTARQIGRVAAIGGEGELGGIQLPKLDVLPAFSKRMPLTVAVAGQEPVAVEVRVLTLGAFLVTRGAIFLQRPAAGGRHKPGKDLLYVRDVLAGGPRVVERVERDLNAMVCHSRQVREYVDYAATNVRLALANDHPAIGEAAAAVAEREGVGAEDAVAEVKGYLTDCVEMLGEALA